MKMVDLGKEKPDIEEVINLAREEPVLLVTSDGKEFLISEVDDFERQVEALRGSHAFQRFLDERSEHTHGTPLEEIEAEIEKEVADKA